MSDKTIPIRVYPQMVFDAIREEHYFTAAYGVTEAFRRDSDLSGRAIESYRLDGALTKHTFCILVLKNGFTVSGENVHLNHADHDPAMARKLAHAKAIGRVYELLAFDLATLRQNERAAVTGEEPFNPIPI